MKKLSFISTIFLLILSYSFAQTSSITNILVSQRTDESWLVDVYFDLEGQGNAYYMNLEVSFNGGANYFYIPGNFLSGDMGPISSGNNKHIVWDGMSNFPNRYSNETKLMIVATTAGSINPCPGSPTVTDVDGNVYNTELIGSQCWMKENLRTTRYRNGAEILNGHFWYDDDISWKYIYGGLYTWYTATDPYGLCPEGWHVPSDAEWTILTNHITGGNVTGGRQLKSCRQVNTPLGGNCETSIHPRWDASTSYGTDEYGFSALPAGITSQPYDSFIQMGICAVFWSSTEYSSTTSYTRRLCNTFNEVDIDDHNKGGGYSVRCIKD
jgi:uncharacterized protein (TIGR02145 family)